MLSAMRSMRSSVRVVPFWYTASLKLSAWTKRGGGLDFGGDFRCFAEAWRGDKKGGGLDFGGDFRCFAEAQRVDKKGEVWILEGFGIFFV